MLMYVYVYVYVYVYASVYVYIVRHIGTWEGSDCWCVEADTGRKNSQTFDQSNGGDYLRCDEGHVGEVDWPRVTAGPRAGEFISLQCYYVHDGKVS